MSDARRSAALILHRPGPLGLEVFLVERSRQLRHWGGHWAFPGGALEAEDATTPLVVADGLSAEDRAIRACAARELFEELGILAVTSAVTSWTDAETHQLRTTMLAGGADRGHFARWLTNRGHAVEVSRFQLLTRLVTPRFSGTRFDTSFFLVESTAAPLLVDGELARGDWFRPATALAAWRQGQMLIVPPVIDLLDSLDEHGLGPTLESYRVAPPEFEHSDRSVRMAPGYELIPVETPPLPAEIPTNVFLVGGKQFVLIDPAPRREAEQQHLFRVVDRRLARGDELVAIVLSHHHPDHVGALEPAIARYRVPLWGHHLTGNLLKKSLDRSLEDADPIELGTSPDGQRGWKLNVLFTPGHAEGHLVFYDARYKTLVAADLVSTLVSMYVGSPGGSLRQYFESIERVQGLDIQTLLPSHGTSSQDPQKLLSDTLRHRRSRIEDLAALLTHEPMETAAATSRLYPDGGGKLRPLMERTTRAALEYLVEDGRAERTGDDVFRRL